MPRRSLTIAAFCASLGLSASTALGQGSDRLPPLKNGMTYNAVLQAWGAPNEKLEYEARRKDVWVYPAAHVTFMNGRLVKWTLKGGGPVSDTGPAPADFNSASMDAIETDPVRPPEPATRGDLATQADLMEEILAEIVKEGPSRDDSPSPVAAANPAIAAANPGVNLSAPAMIPVEPPEE